MAFESQSEFLTGEEAKRFLLDDGSRAEWLDLYESCQWATIFQSVEFSEIWFRSYEGVYAPIFALKRDEAGKLTHLFGLAVNRYRTAVTVPGAHQAEYHAWLSTDDDYGDFLWDVLGFIKSHCKTKTFTLKYLPHGLRVSKFIKKNVTFFPIISESSCCPILDLSDQNKINSSLRKKSNKSRINRMKRMGDLRLKRVESAEELNLYIDDIIDFCDIRNGAINDILPFHADACKKRFHLELTKLGNNFHASLLLLDGKVISAHLGECAAGVLHIGLFVHSPLLDRHSPGKIHLLLLAQELAREGWKQIDLTPGGDAWKDRFATGYEEVFTVIFYLSLSRYARDAIFHFVSARSRSILAAFGIKKEFYKTVVSTVMDVTSVNPIRGLARLSKRVYSRDIELRIYRIERSLYEWPDTEKVAQICRLRDLYLFDNNQHWRSRQGFLRETIERLGNRNEVYTIADGKDLLHFGWVDPKGGKSNFTEVGKEYHYPDGTVVLYDFYTYPQARGRGYYQQNMLQMIADAFVRHDAMYVYISVLANNGPSRHAIEKIGFEYIESVWGRPAPVRTKRAISAS